MPDFEAYLRPDPEPDYPAVRITDGLLHLNEAAIRALRTPHLVELLFDRDTNTVGVRNAVRGNPHAFDVDYPDYPKPGWARIAAGEFTQRYGIGGLSVTCRAHMDKNVLCADLPEAA